MDIYEIEKTVSEKSGRAAPARYLSKIRKNLFFILCQSDDIETLGGIDNFGGREAVQLAIARAMLNLFGLAQAFNVPVAGTVVKELSGQKAAAPGHKKEDSVPAEAPESSHQAQSAPAELNDNISTKILMYENALRSAKSEQEVNDIWRKNIAADSDPEMTGQVKYALGQIKKEALKRFRS